MNCKQFSSNQGMTLLEVTLAVSIFAMAVGAAAQTLVSFYTNMDMQRQRVVAVNECRSMLSDMRNLRDTFPNSKDNPTNFQAHVLQAHPQNSQVTGPTTLRNSTIKVTYEDGSANANPLVPTVTLQWTDLRGRILKASVSSALTDR